MAELTRHSPHPGLDVFTGSPLVVNVAVLSEGGEAVVIDSTASAIQAGRIRRLLENERRRVIAVVNTHWHSDHCGGNRGLVSSGTPVIAHRRHFETISRERNMVSRRPLNIAFDRLVRPSLLVDDRLDLRLGGRTVQLFHAPGHSPDSLAVWDPSRRTLAAGDNLLAGNEAGEPAIPYFYWGDPRRMLDTLEYTRSLKPEFIVPGHGAVLMGGNVGEALESALAYLRWVMERTAGLPSAALETEDEPPPAWLEAAPLTDFLPGSDPPDWLNRMHGLNLLRLALDANR